MAGLGSVSKLGKRLLSRTSGIPRVQSKELPSNLVTKKCKWFDFNILH